MTFSALQKIHNQHLHYLHDNTDFDSIVTIKEGKSTEFPSDRDFAFCSDVEPYIITVAPKLKNQKLSRILAILRHEFGHILLFDNPDHSEQDADNMAETIFGDRIYYDNLSVQTLIPLIYPRPTHIHQ